MVNKGVSPVDTNTDVGQFRVMVGDTTSVPLVPAEAGFGDYTYFSDVELESIIEVAGSGNSGMAFAYRKLAAILALKASAIQTDDLKVATEQRAETMRKIASDFDTAASNETSVADFFMLAGGDARACSAELSDYPWGCYGSSIV